ncbi:MAG: hypothetical protein ABGZ23_03285, partial [Fuerstiella sp.]
MAKGPGGDRSGGAAFRRRMVDQAPKLMNLAGRSVRRNRGAAGVDKVSIEMFETNLDANLNRLMRELKTGEYQPLPARRVYIPKDARKTKFRPLGIPA